MTQQQYENLQIGDILNYGFFSNVRFAGETQDGKNVVMRDKNGNEKAVYKKLFIRYAVLATPQKTE